LSGAPDGLVLLNKPPGRTSFEALQTIKRELGTGKVGHAGTLDKFARGLLLVVAGRYTRLVPYLMPLTKEYRATFRFGEETDTLDVEGKVVRTGVIPGEERIRESVSRFVGDSEQVPPVYSAVHHRGERAHRLVRSGDAPVLRARPIHIDSIQILSFSPPDLTVCVRCSKGTYVRALARDIGRDCGSCAYLIELERTRIGSFSVEEAMPPEEFQPDRHLKTLPSFVDRLPGLNTRMVSASAAGRIRFGIPVNDAMFEQPPKGDGQFALLSTQREFLALVERKEGRYRYLGVFV
jgi:tRNA pseudouridine55 synthase